MIKIMLSAGEVSGDIHGAALAKELLKINPSIELFGMGGEKMRAAKVKTICDLTSKGTIGIIEIFKFLPSILLTFFKMKKLLKDENPDALVLIDYQGFNMLLAKQAKKLGIKTIYYIPPQEWLWGKEKGIKDVATTLDKLLCIFEKETEIYKHYGANAVYVGNPNFDTAKPTMSKEEFCAKFSLNPKFPIFGLFPGSRQQEIDTLLPVFIETAHLIKKSIPNSQFVIAISSLNFKEKIEKVVYSEKDKIKILVLYGLSHDILNACNLAIAASGTIITEAVILNTPIIMAYKISKATYFIAKNLLKINLPYLTMPNILINKLVIPEFIQEEANPENIAKKAIEIITSDHENKKMLNEYKNIRNLLGKPGAVKRAAEEIIVELRGKI